MNRTRLLLALAVVAAAGSIAQAQDSELRAPRIDEAPKAPIVGTYGALLLSVSALVFAASLKPKRTHQD